MKYTEHLDKNKITVIAKGYDILSDSFFVVENDFEEYDYTKHFKEFKDYFNYLKGDIYERSCY